MRSYVGQSLPYHSVAEYFVTWQNTTDRPKSREKFSVDPLGGSMMDLSNTFVPLDGSILKIKSNGRIKYDDA